jgi:hypothetical protein
MKIAFPSLEARKKSQAKEVYEIMRQEVARGPLKVTPLATPWRSKLKQRVLANAKR